MSSPSGELLDSAFTALSDSTRRAVIRALLKKPLRAGELAESVEMTPPALSRHLRVLRKAGLIVEEGVELHVVLIGGASLVVGAFMR